MPNCKNGKKQLQLATMLDYEPSFAKGSSTIVKLRLLPLEQNLACKVNGKLVVIIRNDKAIKQVSRDRTTKASMPHTTEEKNAKCAPWKMKNLQLTSLQIENLLTFAVESNGIHRDQKPTLFIKSHLSNNSIQNTWTKPLEISQWVVAQRLKLCMNTLWTFLSAIKIRKKRNICLHTWNINVPNKMILI